MFISATTRELATYILKQTIGNDSLHQDSIDNGVKIVKFATSRNLFLKTTMFLNRNLHKYTWTSPDRKTHKHTDHTLMDRRWNSIILNVRFFTGVTLIVIIVWLMLMLRKIWLQVNKDRKSWMWKHLI